MAQDCNSAFGRYMRTLRQRRQLSLVEVESLSQGSPDPINKGYLSRFERGRQGIAFGKIITLSRLYEVPQAVLAERMELDMELDRIGGPDTDEKAFAELLKNGKQSLIRGALWDAYGFLRDAVQLAPSSPVLDSFADSAEQLLITCMNTCSAALKLGRARFALHELQYIHEAKRLSQRYSFLVLERIGRAYQTLRNLDLARQHFDNAINQGEEAGSKEWLGYLYFSRGQLAEEESDTELAAMLFQKAFRALKQAGCVRDCAISLLNLAEVYVAKGRFLSAKRALLAAERIARRFDMSRTLGFGRVLLGEIDQRENKPTQATARWREAVTFAKKNNDKLLWFHAELSLYRQALSSGKMAASRAIEKRLRRLSPWIPETIKEVQEFKRLAAERPVSRNEKRVAAMQPPLPPIGNR